MPKICYVDKDFSAEHMGIIRQADAICDEYQGQGFTLTLRQLYYQFVARALVENTMQSYKRLGGIIADARLAGLIDWDAIEDRTRNLEAVTTWDSPRQIIRACAGQFKFDIWATQERRVEVWIEKEALVGVIEPICTELRVPYFACRGYGSASELWAAGQRFDGYADNGQNVTVLHLGDHDPSGIDMTRDNKDRLNLFARDGALVKRLALNSDQVGQYKPPPNPAKITDSRAAEYIKRFGPNSWELDALEPKVIAELIETNIREYIDQDEWDAQSQREQAARDKLEKVAKNWKD